MGAETPESCFLIVGEDLEVERGTGGGGKGLASPEIV